MRRFVLLALVFFPTIAQAADIRSLTDAQGNVSCVLYDAKANWKPPVGSTLSAQPAPNCTSTPSTSVPSPIIGKVEFLARFTLAELIGISAAARSNDGINIWLITAQAHDQIDLTDPLTKRGLDALVSAGLITAVRETLILVP